METEQQVANQFKLLTQRRFLPFFVTQFLGAFNDNVFKNALIILIAFKGAELSTVDANVLTNLSAGLFILPFFIFSATAGQWIDKNEKSRSMRLIKMLEILIMVLAAYAFYLGELYMLIALLFMMGVQSTFFGPAKYSYIPQHLFDNELIAGNALVQSGTFIAILIGTMIGGIFISLDNGSEWVALLLVVVAVAGYISSRFIPHTPSLEPELKINWDPVSETYRNIRFMYGNRTVFLSVLGISWFWFLGATHLVQLPAYTKETLGGNEQVVTLLITLFTVGIGLGSLLCNWLSGHKVELGLVPFGSIGLTLIGIDLYFAKPDIIQDTLIGASAFLASDHSFRILLDIMLIGVFGGFYIVPLFSLVQQRSNQAHLSRIIAGNNIFNALFMVLSAIISIILLKAGVTIAQLLLVVAVFNALVGAYIFTLVPEFFMRFIVWLLIHSIYRVKKHGLENIPDEGPAVLVCNHVSYVDALIIAGCIRRPVRFVTYYKIYNMPVLNFVFRTADAIPIAGKHEDPRLMEAAFEKIEACLKDGELVCIFPEGKLTDDGKMNSFRPGIEKIIEKTPVPVVSMALKGLWGSAFSRHQSFILKKILKGIRSRIDLVIAPSILPETVNATTLHDKVLNLRGINPV